MSDLFNNVKPGDMVHYKTPQGQHGKGKVVLRYDTHVVVNRGKGQPQVVNDNNYVKHERGGKVIGALLSRLKEDKALVAKNKKFVDDKMDKAYKARSGEAWERVHAKQPGIVTRLSARLNGTKLNKQGKVQEMRNPSGPYGGHPYDWDPELRKQIFAGMAKKVKANGPKDTGRDYKPSKSGPPPRRGTPSLQGEDSHDAEGKSARVAKTKRSLRKKLHELDNSTLASYVSKSIADRKKAQGGFEMAGRIWDGERKDRAQAKAFARVSKRTKGIQTAVGKIANNLPAVKSEEVNRHGYEEPLKRHADSEEAKHAGWEPHISEARNEYDANIHMSQGAQKTEKGHYLMRDGRKLSGPHSPEEAVKAYKGLSSQGTDTKGVKIVHVKEGVEIDVTVTLITEDKVKEAAQKAISLAKKAKGNKHVDTEPKLDIQDKGTGGPMEGSHESDGGDVRANV
jgi:hypothetical protein